MASKIKVDQLETADGTGTIALQNQLSGLTTASLPTVTTDKLGTGAVLQVVNANHGQASQITISGSQNGGAEITTDLRLSITPKSATSKLYFNFFTPFVSPNGGNLHYGYFYNVTSSSYVNPPPSSGSRVTPHWTIRVAASDVNDNHDFNMQTVETSGSTTARTYTIKYGNENISAQFFQTTLSTGSGSTFKALFTITEVAG